MSISTKNVVFSINKRRGKNKQGNEYIAYTIRVGEYVTPMLFPTELEQHYLDDVIKDMNHMDFKNGKDTEEPLDLDD